MILIACRVRRRSIDAFCDKPPDHQLYFVYDRLRRFRLVIEEEIFEASVWPFRLGAHELDAHSGVEVNTLSGIHM
jgi:hypothetical protein